MSDQSAHMDADVDLTRLVPLAIELRQDPAAVRRHLAAGLIEAKRYGGRYFFTRHQVEAARAFYESRELARSGS